MYNAIKQKLIKIYSLQGCDKSDQIAVIILSISLLFFGVLPAEAKKRDLDYYQNLLQNRVGSREDTKENCIKYIFCFYSLIEEIRTDIENGDAQIKCIAHPNYIGFAIKLVFLNKDIFLSQNCPKPFQVAFRRLFDSYQSSDFCNDIRIILQKPVCDLVEFFEAISTYLMYNKYNSNAICSCATKSNKTQKVNPIPITDNYRGLIINTLNNKDYYTAKVYAVEFIKLAAIPTDKAAMLRLLGDIETQLRNFENALGSYDQSLRYYRDLKSVKMELNILDSKANIFGELKRTEELMDTVNRIAKIYAENGDFDKQAYQWSKLANYLSKNSNREKAVEYINKALEIYLDKKQWDSVVSTQVMLAANYSDMHEYRLACEAVSQFQSTAQQHNIDVSRETGIFKESIDCSIPPTVLDIHAKVWLVRKLMAQEKYTQAAEESQALYNQALQSYKADEINNISYSEIISIASRCALLSGSFQKAEALAREAIENIQQTYKGYLNLAHALYFQKKYHQAFDIYLKYAGNSVGKDQKWTDGVFQDFKLFEKLGFENAQAIDLRHAIILKTNFSDKKIINDALQDFNKRIVDFNTTKDIPLLELGKVLASSLINTNRSGEGVQALKDVLDAETNFYTHDQQIVNATRYTLANNLFDLKMYRQAEREVNLLIEFWKALTVSNDERLELENAYHRLSEIYCLRGRCRGNVGQLAEAISDYNKALEVDPKNIGAYWDRSSAYEEQEEYELAVKDYREVLKGTPDFTSGYIFLARCLIRQQKYAEAISIYEQGVKRLPNDVDLLSSFASIFVSHDKELQNLQRALSLEQKAVNIVRSRNKKGIKEARQQLAMMLSTLAFYQQLNCQFQESLESVEEAVRLFPINNACVSAMNLAHAYLLTGQVEKALLIHKKYMGTQFDDGREWNNELKNDFQLFREQGVDHPDMKKIEALFAI